MGIIGPYVGPTDKENTDIPLMALAGLLQQGVQEAGIQVRLLGDAAAPTARGR